MRESRLRAVRRGAFLAWVGLWAACAPPPPPPLPELQVEYAGCAEVFLPGPVCALGKKEEKRQIRLWVSQPPEVQITVRVEGRRAKKGLLGLLGWLRPPGPEVSTAAVVAGGQRFTVGIPAGASAVQVRASTPLGEAVWSLQVTTARPWPSPVLAAREMLKQQRPIDALRLLEIQIPTLPREERWLALRLRAEIAQAQGVASSELVELFEEAIAAERAAGALLSEAKGATTLAWIHIEERRFDDAREVLSELRLPAGSPTEAVYDWSYHYGLLAEVSGDARSALASLEQAVEQARRLDLESDRQDAEQVLARQLQGLGRSGEAAALYARLRGALPPDPPSCDRAELLANQAWSLLLAREAGEDVEDPVPILDEGRQSLEDAGCLRLQERLLNYHLNLALAHLQDGRPAEAQTALAKASHLDRFAIPLLRLWGLELEARLRLMEGKPREALDLYGRLEELADSASSPDGLWRAAYGRARCYRAMGRDADALAAYAEAETLLDQRSLQIPIQEGRATFAAQHEGATRSYLELLLAQGRPAEAFGVARWARSRELRHLARENRLARLTPEERRRWDGAIAEYRERRQALDRGVAEDWKLPADQLRRLRAERAVQFRDAQRALDRAFAVLGEPDAAADLARPRSGEVVLAYHPLPDGWVGFAALGKTVAVRRFELPEGALERPEELGARLLAPFREQIERARRVRVLPYGDLSEVDFHALPFGGDILLAARPVVYGLDLAIEGEGAPQTGRAGGRRALVVADPRGDLPAATAEADKVEDALRRQRPAWSTAALRGEKATAEAVRNELAAADLLHYAGHGIYSGFGGWESNLPLAGGSRLALGDVLALEQVPSRVVLSACEAARTGGEAPAEGLSLAHAFLLAGSESVVAATRPVGDRAAEGLFAELYRRWGSELDLAVLLQKAQLDWRRRNPRADWPSFRLYEP